MRNIKIGSAIILESVYVYICQKSTRVYIFDLVEKLRLNTWKNLERLIDEAGERKVHGSTHW